MMHQTIGTLWPGCVVAMVLYIPARAELLYRLLPNALEYPPHCFSLASNQPEWRVAVAGKATAGGGSSVQIEYTVAGQD